MSDLMTSRLGEVMALATAITWAFAVILFKKSGEKVHPIGLNQFKNLLALLLLIPTMLIMSRAFLPSDSVTDYAVLLASGALGIGLADTLFFHSLNILGAGRSAIVDCLYSPFIIGSVVGVARRIAGYRPRNRSDPDHLGCSYDLRRKGHNVDRPKATAARYCVALAMATMAVGIVMAKPVLDRSDLLWVTLTRLVGGISVLFVYLLLHPSRRAIVQSVIVASHRSYTFLGSFIGGYVAMIMWLAGMKFTQASVAAALNQTSAIFIFIFAALFLKERITVIRVVAISIGITGAVMVGIG